MVTFFNKSPDFESVTFGAPAKGGDNRYFIPCHIKRGDGPADEVLCQFSRQVVNTGALSCGTGAEFMLSDEDTVEFVKECDDQMLALCKANKERWFSGKDLSDAYVEQAFMPSLKDVKRQKNTYTLKARTGKDFVMFDATKEAIDSTSVAAHTKMSVILQIAGLWFTSTRFGITWMLRQGKLQEAERITKTGESMFVDDDEEELDANVFPDD